MIDDAMVIPKMILPAIALIAAGLFVGVVAEKVVTLLASGFADQYPLKHELIKKLYGRYRDEGIEIPFPTRTVYVQEEKRDLSKK